MNRYLLAGLGFAACLASRSALADGLTDHSAGLKLLAGADVWSTPSNIPAGYTGLGFAGNGGGFSYGVQPYYELRIIKLIGLETGLDYQHGSFHRNVTYNQVETRETITINSWRLPLLAKLTIPVGVGRFSVGLGPEFTLAQSSSSKLEVTSGAGAIQGTMSTRDVKPTYFMGALGFVIEIPGVGLEIPIELRAANNLSQPSAWTDRVTATSPTSYQVRAESSWVYRLGVGIGYHF
jgi:hypothetical protein